MLWSVVCLNGIAGVSVLSTGKDIMQEVFGNASAHARFLEPSFSVFPKEASLTAPSIPQSSSRGQMATECCLRRPESSALVGGGFAASYLVGLLVVDTRCM